MDEKKLADLFNDAVRDVPPASFDAGAVRTASHRATIKRRNSIVAGSALALVLLAGGAVTTVALSGEMRDSSEVSAPAMGGAPMANSGSMDGGGSAQAPAVPAPRTEELSTNQDDRTGPPKQGGTPSGNAGGAGGTPSGCKADRELAAALAGELPAAANQGQVTVPFGCPAGAGAAAFAVTDGVRKGTISIVLVPPGVEPGFVPMGSNVEGYVPTQAQAAKGGLVYIVSQPAPGTSGAPLSDQIPRYAAEIGTRF
ncbi:hypothetical protein JOF56_002458 [Kibdelosporangium banguiense]|uniref:Uncharacterized protein n=1 Tax=Kibdelosporangium banguiense TaxID=1365924 RepID=A0ABS4TDY2_9PSEU|nr:hypothetical protein [Kibdelosporangium banguiense]MBP2322073.1 hypothetical protein [Kibdelosporangium banguiense]